jgi:hypothetical protein
MRLASPVPCRFLLMLLALSWLPVSAQTVTASAFGSFSGSNGSSPNSIIQAADGSLYGTATYGGSSLTQTSCTDYRTGTAVACCVDSNNDNIGCGTIFKATTAGQPPAMLHSFSGNDGAFPTAIIQGGDGNFYGTTVSGGSSLADNTSCMDSNNNPSPCCLGSNIDSNLQANNVGCGTIFQITPAGVYSVVYNFTGLEDGAFPNALIQGSDTNFYSTSMPCNASSCSFSGSSPYGQIFQFVLSSAASGTPNTLYSFDSINSGAYPNAVIEGKKNTFYGTTVLGGGQVTNNSGCVFYGCGVVFQFTLSGASSGTLSDLCLLSNVIDPNPPACPQSDIRKRAPRPLIIRSQPGRGFPDGGETMSIYLSPNQLLVDKNDNLLGAIPPLNLTEQSCSTLANPTFTSNDTIFQCTSSGSITGFDTIAANSSSSVGVNGNFGQGTLLELGSDGNYYGASLNNIFQVTSASLANAPPSPLPPPPTFYDFSTATADGANPSALIQGGDGNFYGTAEQGGSDTTDCTGGCGTVFELTVTPTTVAPVQLSLSSASVAAGSSVTLSWRALNAFSTTLQQCYAFVQGGQTGAGNWTGLQTGTPGSDGYSGSVSLVPTQTGTYTFALTCGGVESGFATLTVTAPTGPAVTLTASPSSGVTYGQKVTLSASETPVESASDGYTWSIYDGTTALVTGAASSAAGSYTTMSPALSVGQHTFTAVYSSSQSGFASGTSNAVTVEVAKATTATALSASASSANLGSSVSFAATVSTTASGTPTGSVQFLDGSTVLGTASLSGGMASFSTTSLPASTDSITAVYSGDANFNTSTSPAVAVMVSAPNFSLTDNPTSLTIAAGSSGMTTITLTPVGGFTGTVGLSCSSGLPQYSSCSFSQPSLMATGSNTAVTSTLTIQTDVNNPAANLQKARSGIPPSRLLPMLGAGFLAGFPLIFGLRRRLVVVRRMHYILYPVVALALGFTVFVSGCGGGGSSSNNGNPTPTGVVTPAGTSMVVVSALTGTGMTAQTLTLTVTIQ